jgi:hypothetical protein
MLLELLLGGPKKCRDGLLREAARTVQRGDLGLWHVDVGTLQQGCARTPGWQQVAMLGDLAFAFMVVEQPEERYSGARLARLPPFEELPTWRELGQLARLLRPRPAASS